jgi:hypothetical protein
MRLPRWIESRAGINRDKRDPSAHGGFGVAKRIADHLAELARKGGPYLERLRGSVKPRRACAIPGNGLTLARVTALKQLEAALHEKNGSIRSTSLMWRLIGAYGDLQPHLHLATCMAIT